MPQPLALTAPVYASDGTYPVLPLLARSAAASVDLVNLMSKGVIVFTNITVNAGGAGSIVVTIRSKDPISGNYITILASAAYTTVAQQVTLKVYPGLTASANVIASDVIPHDWNIQVSSNASPVTFSVAASLIS